MWAVVGTLYFGGIPPVSKLTVLMNTLSDTSVCGVIATRRFAHLVGISSSRPSVTYFSERR